MNRETNSSRHAKRFIRVPTSDVIRILVMRAVRSIELAAAKGRGYLRNIFLDRLAKISVLLELGGRGVGLSP